MLMLLTLRHDAYSLALFRLSLRADAAAATPLPLRDYATPVSRRDVATSAEARNAR